MTKYLKFVRVSEKQSFYNVVNQSNNFLGSVFREEGTPWMFIPNPIYPSLIVDDMVEIGEWCKYMDYYEPDFHNSSLFG